MFAKGPSLVLQRVTAILLLLSGSVLPHGGTLAPEVGAGAIPAPVVDRIPGFNPTDTELDRFTVSEYAGGRVLVEWHTGLEVRNLGFNVYSETNGNRVRLTPQLIAGSALAAGEGASAKPGYTYAWPDEPRDVKGVQYWLEAIDLNGNGKMFGPVSAAPARTPNVPRPKRGAALLLSDVGRSSSAGDLNPAHSPQLTAQQLSGQSNAAGQEAIKLFVNQEGWYRVTQPELVAAGLDNRVDPGRLHLYAGGKEQHFIVRGEEDGHFDPSDSIEFYGLGLDTVATGTRVYWLTEGPDPGLRIQKSKGKGSRAAPPSSLYTVELKERRIYFSGLRNGAKQNFFGSVLVRNPVDQVIVVKHLAPNSAEGATLEVALQGVSEMTHRVNVELNGIKVGELNFVGQSESLGRFALATTALKDGQNTVTLTPLGAESDVSLVSYIRITYPHTFSAEGNSWRFTLPNKRRVTIDGFSSPNVRVLDITDSDEVREVSAQVEQQGAGYAVTVSSPKPGGRTIWAVADDQTKHVAAIEPNLPSNLRGRDQAADFLIIAHRDFVDSVKPLRLHRESQGLTVTIVDVDDVYDEFSYGDKSPQAIKDFLEYATTSWRTAPRFVLFVGDASLDPRNFMGRGDYDFVPSSFVDTLLMETVSDEWLADFNGDGLAEIALGRLPVRTADEVSRIIDKIVSYDGALGTKNVLLVSDLNDGIDFYSSLVQIRSLVPPDVNVAQIDRGALGTTAARAELIDRLNRGPGIVSYFGHGSIDQWRGDLLTSADAAELENGELRPVVFAITCLNGYFQDPILDSLAESLLLSERGGAVAVWASSGMCDAMPQAIMDQELFRIIFAGGQSSNGQLTLGEAIRNAKRSISDTDVRLTYVLFGDPTSRIK